MASVEEPEEKPIDILAADEFPVGDRAEKPHDDGLQPPHDVLAADEFAMPAADPLLHHQHEIHAHEHAHNDDHDHSHAHEQDDDAHEHGDVEISLPALGGAITGFLAALWLLVRRRRRSSSDND